jgi:6-phospho-beta-glucosidase
MKIAVIGGGSTYTPELVSGLLQQIDHLPLKELWLMDISPKRLEVVGGFIQRMVAAAGSPFEVYLSSDRRKTIQDAEYVITQFRVGGMQARREDEYLGKRHGLIGQETNGVGGMANALRTIPVILQIAGEISELAPEALLINFANPSGIITEALQRYAPQIRSVGLCNGPITTEMRLLEILQEQQDLQIDPGEAFLDSLGLNHFGWYRALNIHGENFLPRLLRAYPSHVDFPWDVRTIEALGMLPNSYLKYYYYTEKMLNEQEQWPPSRAEQVMQVEADLINQYACGDGANLPDDLLKRGGSYYSTLATYVIYSHYNDLGMIQTANTRHNGSVDGYPEEWVLELPCRIDRAGIHPLPAAPLPVVCYGPLTTMKSFELLTVEAAVHGDRDLAYQALLVNPLGPSADKIQAVWEDLLKTNRAYLPQFI